MGKNKYVDLFTDMMPAVDTNCKELWDAAGDDGQKDIKGDLWILNRWISGIKTDNRELQEHYVEAVNHVYNKNWNAISKHPKLQWQTLCVASFNKKKHSHAWIPLKKQKNKKEEWLAEQFPNMKLKDIETLAAITTDKDIKEYARDLGWDKQQIAKIKL